MNKVVEKAKERSKRILIAEKGHIKAPIFLDDLEVLLQALDNSIDKKALKDKREKLKKEYFEAMQTNGTKAFIIKCQIEFIGELLEEK